LKDLDICKDCKFYWVECDGGREIHRCMNDERWFEEGYTEEDFEEDECGEIDIMASFEYNARGEIIDCDFYGTCGGKFKKEREGV